MGIFKGFAKFNGYTVAVACINYTLTKVLSSNIEGKFVETFSFLKNLLATAEQPSSVSYVALLIASITLFLGIFLECKALMVPFIVAYIKVLDDETGGTYKMATVWELLFSAYAAFTLVMLFSMGICTCFRSKDERDQKKQPSWISQCCWTFWGCRCCRRRGREIYPTTLDAHSHCSCETLNIRTAGPDDKHYHRVIFV
uniref:Putative conserved plasma membrane protein n=1 Tax=Aedes albopictus TaxID=7160 RepID=A0A023EJ91_AEDAL